MNLNRGLRRLFVTCSIFLWVWWYIDHVPGLRPSRVDIDFWVLGVGMNIVLLVVFLLIRWTVKGFMNDEEISDNSSPDEE